MATSRTRKKTSDQRLEWWREAKFGLFIHWGLYAIPAGTWKRQQIDGIGEWIMNRARIPVREYEKLAQQFNPVGFDAEEWVRVALPSSPPCSIPLPAWRGRDGCP